MAHIRHLLLGAALTFATPGLLSADVITVFGSAADGAVDVNGQPSDLTFTQLRAGVGGNDIRGFATIFFFALPTLPSQNSLMGAQLQLSYLGISNFTVTTVPDFNADLFGLGTRVTPTILAADYYDGNAAGGTGLLLSQGLITPTSVPGVVQPPSPALLNYIWSLYNADGTPTAAFVVFRLNPDIDLPLFSGPYRGYEVASGDNLSVDLIPQLTLTFRPQAQADPVPEPVTLVVWGLCLIPLFGVLARRR